MLKRIATLAVLGLALGGCYLQSKTPVIPANGGELLLKDYGDRFVSYSLKGDKWESDGDIVTFTAKGDHYEGSDGKDTFEVALARIKGPWWLGQQTHEDKSGYDYALVEALPKDLLIHVVDCNDLKKAGGFDSLVEFQKDDCFVKEGADTVALLKALVAAVATSDPTRWSVLVPKG